MATIIDINGKTCNIPEDYETIENHANILSREIHHLLLLSMNLEYCRNSPPLPTPPLCTMGKYFIFSKSS